MSRQTTSVLSRSFLSRPVFSIILALFMLGLAITATPRAVAQTFTVLHAFTGGPDGGFPSNNGLILDAAGNLYGTTDIGGTGADCSATGGCGTVFKISPAGKLTVLYSFNGTGSDGKFPNGALIRDSAGNLYGTTSGGGTSGTGCNGYGCGTVFMLTKTGQETVLYSFSGGVDGATPEGGLARDLQGGLYGTTHLGGTYNWGTVFMVYASGGETVLHSFDGPAGDGGDAYAGLILDSSTGMLYGTTPGGGIFNSNCLPGFEIGCGTIFQITTTGTESVIYDFTGLKDGNTPFSSLIRDKGGNLYGTSQPQPTPTGWGTVYRLDTAGKLHVLHTFSGGAGGADPLSGVVRDAAGNIYGTTSAGGTGNCTYYPGGGCGTVYKLTPAGLFTVLYNFRGASDGANPTAGLAIDTSGNLYGTTAQAGAHNEGTVFKITP